MKATIVVLASFCVSAVAARFAVAEPVQGLENIIRHLREAKAYSQALGVVNQEMMRHEGQEFPKVYKLLLHKTEMLSHTGKYDESGKALGRAISILEKAKGEDEPDLIPHFMKMSQLFMRQGKLTEAMTAAERASAIAAVTEDDRQDDVGPLMTQAQSYMVAGRYENAVVCWTNAIEIASKKGAESGLPVTCLAECYAKMGREKDAAEMYARGLELLKGGEQSAAALLCGAKALEGLGKIDEAEAACGRALTALEGEGTGGAEDIPFLEDVATFYRSIEKNDEAEQIDARIAAIRAQYR